MGWSMTVNFGLKQCKLFILLQGTWASELTNHRSGFVHFNFHTCLGTGGFGGPGNLWLKLPHWELEARFTAIPVPFQLSPDENWKSCLLSHWQLRKRLSFSTYIQLASLWSSSASTAIFITMNWIFHECSFPPANFQWALYWHGTLWRFKKSLFNSVVLSFLPEELTTVQDEYYCALLIKKV